jgi:hypothetical protein
MGRGIGAIGGAMRATLGWKDQVGNHEFREWDEWEAERGGTMGRGWVCGTCFAAGVRAHQGWCVGRPGWVYKHAKVERVGWGHCSRTGGGWGGELGESMGGEGDLGVCRSPLKDSEMLTISISRRRLSIGLAV